MLIILVVAVVAKCGGWGISGEFKGGAAVLMVFGKVMPLVIVFLMLLLRMVVVVTFIVEAELLVVGNDSAAPSGCRESLPENNFNVTPTKQLHHFQNVTYTPFC